MPNPNPRARVSVDVTNFIDVLNTPLGVGNRVCAATVILEKSITKVITQNPPKTGSIIVYAPVEVEFKMLGATTYRLAGIAFRNSSAAFRLHQKGTKTRRDEHGNGSENMPKDSILINESGNGDTTIQITDDFSTHGVPPNQPTWEFYLLVQDSHGFVGIIDPDIENQSEAMKRGRSRAS